ncbi:hypothetical protein JOE65_002295 [Arthrobacter roseus]|nr:hypothetical protein [Arthrobacter roseus]
MTPLDERPSWLPPIPPPNRGRALIVFGLILVLGTVIFIVTMAYIGGSHNLYTLWPFALGILFLVWGFLRREEGR